MASSPTFAAFCQKLLVCLEQLFNRFVLGYLARRRIDNRHLRRRRVGRRGRILCRRQGCWECLSPSAGRLPFLNAGVMSWRKHLLLQLFHAVEPLPVEPVWVQKVLPPGPEDT